MPYLVEMLHASAISALYHPLEEKLEFSIHATIAKGTVHQHIRKRGVHDISVTTSVDFGANLFVYLDHLYEQLFFLLTKNAFCS